MALLLRCLLGALAFLAVMGALSAPARAGSEAEPADLLPLETAAAFSKQIERELASHGARAALVFRTGRAREDLPDGVRYTHGALWIHQRFVLEDGSEAWGYATWNLFHFRDEPTRSYLARQLPLDFARGALIAEAGIVIPTPEMQRRLIAMAREGGLEAVHQPAYSLISNPHDARYQNCNEYLLDLVAAAVWETTERTRLKANLSAWFEPGELRVSGLERLFGPMVDTRLRTDDHRGPLRTTTFTALARFMADHGLSDFSDELVFAPG